MKSCMRWMMALLVLALMVPAGLAFGQGRMADIEDAKSLVASNPTFNNRLRLATLQYLDGVDYLKAGNQTAAIDSMQASVWTLEDGKGQIPENHPVFEAARYGLGSALVQNDNPYEALLVLDKAVAATPDFGKARYLLGTTLISIPGEQSQQRGIDVMTALAQDGRAPYKEWAQNAATRIAYNISTLRHARGDAAAAASLLGDTTSAVGGVKGASTGETTQVRFALGVYLRDSGDTFGALEQLEAANKEDAGYRLSNGVALSGVLSNVYYAAGLDQLQLGGESANHVSVEMFDGALNVGDSAALDAHHGKAVAHTRLGQTAEAVKELQAIVAKDPTYYSRIKAK